jgi:hypothetical protein
MIYGLWAPTLKGLKFRRRMLRFLSIRCLETDNGTAFAKFEGEDQVSENRVVAPFPLWKGADDSGEADAATTLFGHDLWA